MAKAMSTPEGIEIFHRVAQAKLLGPQGANISDEAMKAIVANARRLGLFAEEKVTEPTPRGVAKGST